MIRRFLPVATSHQRYPSSLTLASTTDSISLGLLFAYKVATHPNVTFYLNFQDVEIEEPCFRFPPFSFASLFRPPFLLVLLSIHFSTGLRLIIGILCFLIFPPIRWFPSLSTVSLPNTPSTPPPPLERSTRFGGIRTRHVWFLLFRLAGCDFSVFLAAERVLFVSRLYIALNYVDN